ncbi:hypothetical protein AB0I72_24545 [Nocardiopsis sp. NPDC049922]|uniref:hypothetical protein n=1 Tax=Nocardiopsis sp. NPDC049922 TaxID=3155157 RepID=UPI003407D14D
MKKTFTRVLVAGFVAPAVALTAPSVAFADYDYHPPKKKHSVVIKDNIKKHGVIEVENEVTSTNVNNNNLVNVQGQYQDQYQDQDQLQLQDQDQEQEQEQEQVGVEID